MATCEQTSSPDSTRHGVRPRTRSICGTTPRPPAGPRQDIREALIEASSRVLAMAT